MCSGCARLRQSMFCCYYKFLFAIIKSELRKCLRVLFRMISGIFADKFTHVSYAPHSPHHSTHTQHSHTTLTQMNVRSSYSGDSGRKLPRNQFDMPNDRMRYGLLRTRSKALHVHVHWLRYNEICTIRKQMQNCDR